METAPSPLPPLPPSPPPTAAPSTWPRSAQLALAFLLGVACTLVLVQWIGSERWWTRPADVDHGAALAYRADLNRASHAELVQLPGVGESTAARIEDYRSQHGDFQRVSDLLQVKRVGPATLRRVESWVSAGGNADAPQPARTQASGAPPIKKPAPHQERAAAKPRGIGKKAAALKAPVDLNAATAAELQHVPWIGPATAQHILNERQKRPFASVDELLRVPGIKAKKLEHIRPYVTVGGPNLRVATMAQAPETE